jgi:hypothetical protein
LRQREVDLQGGVAIALEVGAGERDVGLRHRCRSAAGPSASLTMVSDALSTSVITRFCSMLLAGEEPGLGERRDDRLPRGALVG